MLDIDKLPKDTIVTTEMLNPKQGERIMVIEHKGKEYQSTRYNGTIEIDAYRTYRNIKHKDKIMFKALVTYSNLFKKWTDGDEFILDYEILEIIEEGLK
ncbi:hypothetical protein G8T71_10800 [Clostridium botulinum C/D]|uniref:hypothetical protein n=1 Tax=Clostridium botulinum TaxID=1491 RepID=UPI001E381FD9|nr:hypothetical protein [Clostridium botulinum]MCD3211842.1 hypothetical protein [Clostridium botulinum C/D]